MGLHRRCVGFGVGEDRTRSGEGQKTGMGEGRVLSEPGLEEIVRPNTQTSPDLQLYQKEMEEALFPVAFKTHEQ